MADEWWKNAEPVDQNPPEDQEKWWLEAENVTFEGEGFGATAARRGQQAAQGFAEVAAGAPEAAAIMREATSKGQVSAAQGVIQRKMDEVDRLTAQIERVGPETVSGRAFSRKLERTLADIAEAEKALPEWERSAATPAEETDLYKAGDQIRAATESVFGEPDPRDTSFWAAVAQGAGNAAGFIALSTAGGAVGGPMTALTAGGAAGMGMNQSQVFKEALESGADRQDALRASMFAAGVGALEIVPIDRALKLLPPRLKEAVGKRFYKFIADTVQGAGEEAAQEAIAQIANNMIASGIYDPERGWMDGVTESALVGAVLGGALSGGASAASGTLSRDRQDREPPDEGEDVASAPSPPTGDPASGEKPGELPAPAIVTPVDPETSTLGPDERKPAAAREPEFSSRQAPKESAVLLAAGEAPEDIMAMNEGEAAEAASEAIANGVKPLDEAETMAAMAPAVEAFNLERPESERLTPGDRASSIPNDLIDDGKAEMEDMISSIGKGGSQAQTTPFVLPPSNRRAQVVAPDGTEVEVAYEVVDANKLRAAPPEFQPRDRTRVESDAQISEISAKLDPLRLMPAREAGSGAPIVGPDGIVESGNGRRAALIRAASENPEGLQKYIAELRKQGFDIPPDAEIPMLVGRRLTSFSPQDRQKWTVSANAPSVSAMSATENAEADVMALSPDTMGVYQMDAPLSSTRNGAFVQRFLSSLPQTVRAGLTDADGRLNSTGIQRIKNAMFAKAYGDRNIISRVAEGEGDRAQAILNALTEFAPTWAAFRADVEAGRVDPDFDLTSNILEALQVLTKARQDAKAQGRPVPTVLKEMMGQGDIFGGDMAPETAAIIIAFHQDASLTRPVSKESILKRLKFMVDELRAAGDTAPSLIGKDPDATPEKAVNAAAARDREAEADLFAEPEPGKGDGDRSGDRPGERGEEGSARPEDGGGSEEAGQGGDAVAAAASEADPDPTEPQKEAGNYQKGHITLQGLDISIENAKGAERTGTDSDGETWSVTMPAHYGYIRGTEGADGDHVDVYIGDTPNSDIVVIVNQVDLETGEFDEHKVILGATSRANALRLYDEGFSDGRGKDRIGSATTTNMEGFKAWLKNGDQSKPTEPLQPKKPAAASGADAAPAAPPPRPASATQGDGGGASKPKKPDGPREIGVNADGLKIFEDENGVRSYVEKGISVTESVNVIPGQGMSVDPSKRGKNYLTREEYADKVRVDTSSEMLDDLTNRSGESVVGNDRYKIIEGTKDQGWRVIITALKGGTNTRDITREESANEGPWPRDRAVEEAIKRAFPQKKPAKKPAGKRADDTSSLTMEEQDRLAELRAKFRAKMRDQLNVGLDPELVAIAAEMGSIYIKAGARKFRDLVRAMMEDLGLTFDQAQPYARNAYNQARDDMELDGQDISDMDDARAVIQTVRDMREEEKGPDQDEQQAPEPTPEPDSPEQDTTEAPNIQPEPPEPKPVEKTPPATSATFATNLSPLAAAFRDFFLNGDGFSNIRGPRLFAQDFGVTDPKRVEEELEAGIVAAARKIAADAENQEAAYDALVALYESQPLLAERTSTSVEQQAYSTPAPLAYLASRRAGIDGKTTVYEPSAGNGMLLVEASQEQTTANELNPDRAEVLRRGGWSVITQDAMDVDLGFKVDRVIANPPFGKVSDDGKTKVFKVGDFETKEIDHAVSMKALSEMKDGGRAVLIIGGKQAKTDKERAVKYRADASRRFFNRLYGEYNVVDHFTVAGDLYKRQGAGWPVDVIVIEGRGKSDLALPMATAPRIYDSWDALKETLDDRLAISEQSPDGGERAPAVEPAGEGRPSDAGIGSGNPDSQNDLFGDAGEGSGDSGTASDGGRTEPRPKPEGDRKPSGGEQQSPEGSRPDSDIFGAAQQDQARPGNREGDQGSLSGRDGQRRPGARYSRVNKEAETSLQVQYSPTSNAEYAVGTLVPKNMQTAMTAALSDLETRVGDIDDFVAEKLGYSRDEMLGTKDKPGYFSAEQVDALALAIDNVERGAGFIIGDQTGVGKGRFVAAMLRYAGRNGLVPVFVTKDPGLYGDMIRDMRDIGMKDADKGVLMTNFGLRGDKAIPLSNENPGDTLKSPTNSKVLKALAETKKNGRLPAGYSFLFTSYPQLQYKPGGEMYPRQEAVMAVAPNAMFVFDESHEAGGSERTIMDKEGEPRRNRADFVRELISEARGVVYSSATYAKNPTVMSLYSKTDMSLAVDKMDDLGDVIKKGGVPLQQVIANMLVVSGQYARRERSYKGVEMDFTPLEADVELARTASEGLRKIFMLDSEMMEDARENFIEKKAREGWAGMTDMAVGEVSANGIGFANIMHNVVNQMLLSLKAPGAAADAISAWEKGEKPILALSNTNESILTDFIYGENLSVGDKADLRFNEIMIRYLNRTRRITLKDPSDKKVHIFMTDADLDEYGPEGTLEAFKSVEKAIREMDLQDLPASPIDYILDQMAQAGMGVDEITGRQVTLRGGEIGQRDSSPAAKKRVMNRYNSGDVDGLVINKSGSTGFSLHATDKPDNDGKPRYMIVLQPDPNIDVFMQMLGRIHRTGQIELPRYKIGISNLAVEKRLAARLMSKMASLSANTTASKESAISIDATDMLNPYGDQIVVEYLRENKDVAAMANVFPGASADANAGIAAKFTGRLAIFDPDKTSEIYQEIESAYNSYIETLDAMGMNNLEAKTLELDAKTISSVELTPVKDESSVFGGASYTEVIDAKVLGKPYTSDQVEEKVKEAVKEGAEPNAQIAELRGLMPVFLDDAREGLQKAQDRRNAAKTKKQEDNADAAISNWNTRISSAQEHMNSVDALVRKLEPGAAFKMTTKEGDNEISVSAVSLGADTSKVGKNPTALSRITFRFAIANASREVRIPASKIIGEEPTVVLEKRGLDQAMKSFDEGQEIAREKRQIITGNLIAGFEKVGRGQIVIFRDSEKNLREGILLPKDFDVGKHLERQAVSFATGQQVKDFLDPIEGQSRMVTSSDGIMGMSINSEGLLAITVKRKGGKPYYLLKPVRDIVGDFKSRQGAFTNTAPRSRIPEIVQTYQDNLGVTFETNADKDAARKITGEEIPDTGDDGPMFAQANPLGWESTGGTDFTVPEKAQKDLRRRLDSMGLSDVTLNFDPNFSTENVEGQKSGEKVYPAGIATVKRGNDGTITPLIVIASSSNPTRTLDHESIHQLKNLGAFTKEEWAALSRRAEELWIRKHQIKDRYPTGSKSLWIEEAIAEEYASWSQKEDKREPSMVRGAFRKIADLLEMLRNWVNGNGLQSTFKTFSNVKSGDIGGRDRRWRGGDIYKAQIEGKPEASSFDRYEHATAHQAVRVFRSWSEMTGRDGWEKIGQALRRNFADRMNDLRGQQEKIKKSGIEIPIQQDAYIAESLFYGRTADRLRDFYEKEVQPITDAIREAGLTPRQVDDYLIARHVAERNKQIAKLYQDRPDHPFYRALEDPSIKGGSGFSRNEAQIMLASLSGGRGAQQALRRIGRMVNALNERALTRQVNYGLTSQEAADAMQAAYSNYVPLRGHEVADDSVEGGGNGTGRGFDTRGPESRRAAGRGSRADSPLGYVFAQGATGIIRGEKNRVGKTLLRLVEANPNDAVWSIDRSQTKTNIQRRKVVKIDPASGMPQVSYEDRAITKNQSPSRIDPNTMIVKVGGKEVYITFASRGLADAMKNMGADNANAFVNVMGPIIRMMSALNTTLNPEWFITNLFRDFTAAGIQISDEKKRGMAKEMAKNWAPAMKGAFQYLSGRGSGEWADIAKDFAQNGGKVDYIEFRDIEGFKDMIQGEVSPSKLRSMMNKGPKRVLGAIDVLTGSGENAIRIAAYKAAIDAGIPKAKAASIARELTVNFNRKGTMGPTMNAIYMFFNAAVQGNMRLARSVAVSKFTRKALVGLAVIGFLETILGMGDDDEYEKLEDWVIERNIVIMLNPLGIGSKGDYAKIPLPYGFNVFKAFGTQIGRATLHGTDPTEAALAAVTAAANSFNPINGQDLLAMLIPSVADPPAEVARNRNFFDSNIRPDYPNDRRPDSEKYFPNVSDTSRAISEWLNNATGGNQFREGAISISPENIDHMVMGYLGGLGRLFTRTQSVVNDLMGGKAPEAEDTPFVRQVFGRTSGEMPTWRAYKRIREDVHALEYEIDGMKDTGNSAGIQEARERNPVYTRMIPTLKAREKKLSQIRKEEKRVKASTMDDDRKQEALDKLRQESYEIQRDTLDLYDTLSEKYGR